MPSWNDTPPVGEDYWMSMYGGIEWRYDATGIYIRGLDQPLRTDGEPITCQTIIDHFDDNIINYAIEFNIPPEIIVMTIATEAAAYRRIGFTGPETFRWEPHVKVKDVEPNHYGDYSLGPMQTLATTARWVIRTQGLNFDPFGVMPDFKEQPVVPPDDLPGYDPEINIHIGVAEIKQRWDRTGDNPILVSACYNAGGLYSSNSNRWHLRSHGNHLDRAAKWFGDACFVIDELRT
jgi:peptidoglycan L-alanyl-D-glutamate endopeptidase CwlK